MLAELITIETDAEPMHGAFYAAHGTMRGAALLMHGNCHNFYTGPSRFLPPVLTARGIACLAFNRRGHEMVTSLQGREIGGGAFQTAAQAIADGELASAWLKDRCGITPMLIGHSNGGMLAAHHAAVHSDTPLLVLLSAHCGGKNIAALNSANGLFARDRLDELTDQARRLVAEGKGRELMLMPGWWWVISAESFLEYALRGTPDTVAQAEHVRCPSLYIRGDLERPEIYPAEIFAERSAGRCEARVLPNCDHFYTGQETEVAEMVADWVTARL